jgi:hypothetical protein
MSPFSTPRSTSRRKLLPLWASLLWGAAAFVSASSAHADTQLSIFRDFKRSGGGGTRSVALMCAREEPRLGDCTIVRASNGALQKTVKIDASVAKQILTVGTRSLSSFAQAAPDPTASLRWTLNYLGKSLSGSARARKAPTPALTKLESRLNRELDR